MRALFSYMASEEGQQRVAQPDVAGAAPISDDLHARVMDVVDRIEGP